MKSMMRSVGWGNKALVLGKAVSIALVTLAGIFAVSVGHAASFDCKKVSTEVEKLICGDYTLSNMDSKLAMFYHQAREKIANPEALKAAQRAWLKERDRCIELSEKEEACSCLKKRYDRRIDELRVLAAGHKLWDQPPAMTQGDIERVYVTERRETLKTLFKDRPLETALGEDDPLCANFARDFAVQNEAVELVPPKVVAHDYDDQQLQKEIFDYCPDLELRSYKIGMSGPYVGPCNFLLYEVDVDNLQENGKELLFLEEAMWMREPKYGPEIVAKEEFTLVDLSACERPGFSATGASRRYRVNRDVSGADPQTGLHGHALPGKILSLRRG